MTLRVGSLDVIDVRIGSIGATKVLLGTVQVWPTGPGVVTGSVAAVEAPHVALIVGTVTAPVPPVVGAVAADEALDLAAIEGTFTPLGVVGGPIDATEADDLAAIVGTVTAPVYSGVIAAAEDGDLAVIEATSTAPIYAGTIAASEDDDLATVVGTSTAPIYTGTIGAVEDSDVAAIVGSYTPEAITGTIGAVEADDVSVITGDVTIGVVTGVIAVTEADDTAAIAGTMEFVGAVAATEEADASVIVGTFGPTGAVAATEATDVAVIAGTFTGSAFPTIAAINSEVGTSMGAQPINMPAGIVAGDLLIAVAVNDTPAATVMTASAGWTEIRQQVQGANVLRLAAFGRIADGTATDNLTITGAAQDYAAWTGRITGHAINTIAAVFVADATGATGNGDPPSLATDSDRGWLWLAAEGVDLTTGNTITSVPSGYTPQFNNVSASSTSSVALAVGSRTAAGVTTENPATFTNNPTTRPWVAFTIGIPAAPPAPVTGTIAVTEADDVAAISGNDGTAGTASFVSIAAITANLGSPFDIPKPAGAAVGDLYVICWYCDIQTAVATCTGFVDAGHGTYVGFGGAVRAFGALKRVADGSEGATFTVAGLAGGGAGYNEAIALAYDASGTGAFGSVNASLNSPALAVGANNSIEMLALNTANATGNFAAPAGWTRRLNGNGTYGFWIADRPVNAGTTTPSTFTGATDLGNGYGMFNLVITP